MIPKHSSEKPSTYRVLTNLEISLYGLDKSFDESPHVNLKYVQTNYECFSDWTINDLKDFSSFLNKLEKSNWNDIMRSGGKLGSKTGFAYTKHKDKTKLPSSSIINKISDDVDFFELRINKKARVHGFRCASTFFLVWLDRNHLIYNR